MLFKKCKINRYNFHRKYKWHRFFGTQVNENTDFENTLNIGQAVNADHIQFVYKKEQMKHMLGRNL